MSELKSFLEKYYEPAIDTKSEGYDNPVNPLLVMPPKKDVPSKKIIEPVIEEVEEEPSPAHQKFNLIQKLFGI